MISDLLEVPKMIAARLGTEDLEFEFLEFRYTRKRGRRAGVQEFAALETQRLSTLRADFLSKRFGDLPLEHDYAITNRVLLPRAHLFFPQVDFGSSATEEEVVAISEDLKVHYPGKYLLYKTQRSWHLYGDVPMYFQDWVAFCGSTLLSNVEAYATGDLIDIRWIGHQLKRGHSALRWSANSGRYTSIPSLKRAI